MTTPNNETTNTEEITNTEETSLSVQEEINQPLTVFGYDKFPPKVKEGIENVMTIINENKTLPDLYTNELKEIMISTSIFQDICVQMEEHFTPHRKLRQVMLELENKLGALHTAKSGHAKSIIKLECLKDDIEELQDLYNSIKENNKLDFDSALRLANVSYHTKEGMENVIKHSILPENLLNVFSNNPNLEIDNDHIISSILNKLKIALANKVTENEENVRDLKSAQHMIKDAAVKVYQYQEQAKIYTKLVEESGISFDESEFIYYTMFFTAEAERQLRTGDHQIDRGTFKAISQLPIFIREKVLKNIDQLVNLIQNSEDRKDDFFFLTHNELFEPNIERDENGDLLVEGYYVKDYILMEPIQTISPKEETKTNDQYS